MAGRRLQEAGNPGPCPSGDARGQHQCPQQGRNWRDLRWQQEAGLLEKPAQKGEREAATRPKAQLLIFLPQPRPHPLLLPQFCPVGRAGQWSVLTQRWRGSGAPRRRIRGAFNDTQASQLSGLRHTTRRRGTRAE